MQGRAAQGCAARERSSSPSRSLARAEDDPMPGRRATAAGKLPAEARDRAAAAPARKERFVRSRRFLAGRFIFMLGLWWWRTRADSNTAVAAVSSDLGVPPTPPQVGVYPPHEMSRPLSLMVADGAPFLCNPPFAPGVFGTSRGACGRWSARRIEPRCPRYRSRRRNRGTLGDPAPDPRPLGHGTFPQLPAGRQMDVLVKGTEPWMKAFVARRSVDRIRVASAEPLLPAARSVEEPREPEPFGFASVATTGGYGEDSALHPYSSGALAAISPEGAVPVRLSGREAKKSLPPMGLPGRSAEEMQQGGVATALNPVCALEMGRLSAVAPSSDDGSQERWTGREASHCRAPDCGSSLSLMRLEMGALLILGR